LTDQDRYTELGINLTDNDLYDELGWVGLPQNLPPIPVLEKPYTQILAAINQPGCKLRMIDWHTCDTTHCLGGWAIHLTGAAGRLLSSWLGYKNAAAFILRKSRPDAPNPIDQFYVDDDAAMAFINARVAEEAADGELHPVQA
jgi:hypothetical protein